jgi:uncharacterized membrane protein YfcA
MKPMHWMIVLAAALGGVTGVLFGPWIVSMVPAEPVWLRPVAVIGLLLVGVLLIAGGVMLRRQRS